jgi:sugar lactone lactonase YvrE
MRVLVDGTLTEPRLDHPEGVAVARDGSVWCGGERGQIYRYDDGVLEEVASTGGFILGLAFDAHGDLFVCDIKHGAVFRYRDGLERVADGFTNPNAIAFDAQGRMYVSDSLSPAGPGLYRYEPDGSGGLWDERPLLFANGIALYEARRARRASSRVWTMCFRTGWRSTWRDGCTWPATSRARSCGSPTGR